MTTLPEQARALAAKILSNRMCKLTAPQRRAAEMLAEDYDSEEMGFLAVALQDALDLAHADAAALREACQNFVDKVERGEARSRRSYAEMKAALSTTAGRDMLERARNVDAQANLGTFWHEKYDELMDEAKKIEARLTTGEADARRKAIVECLEYVRKTGFGGAIKRPLIEGLHALIAKGPTDGEPTLPCDITLGNCTFRKGVKMSVLQGKLTRMYERYAGLARHWAERSVTPIPRLEDDEEPTDGQ